MLDKLFANDLTNKERTSLMTKEYIENPKTKGSGIMCCIPHKGVCPVGCADCFFQSGRSYLEPLEEHLPNMPDAKFIKDGDFVVRVNDGNDSNNNPKAVMQAVAKYRKRFYNTSMSGGLDKFDAPVVLTINPASLTDSSFSRLSAIPPNLMFVRMRTNTWNLELTDEAVKYYSKRNVPIVLTFMAYYTMSIPAGHERNYTYRQRTLNSYWVITPAAWDMVMARYVKNPLVHACGKDANTFACSACGNCLREYYSTMKHFDPTLIAKA